MSVDVCVRLGNLITLSKKQGDKGRRGLGRRGEAGRDKLIHSTDVWSAHVCAGHSSGMFEQCSGNVCSSRNFVES